MPGRTQDDPFVDSDYDDDIEVEIANTSRIDPMFSSSSAEGENITDSTSEGEKQATGTLTWHRQPRRKKRDKRWDAVEKPTGLSDEAENVTTRAEAFKLFLTQEIMDEMVKWTAQKISEDDQRYKDEKAPSQEELNAFIGLLFHSGRMGTTQVPINDLWTTDPFDKMDIFQATMGRNRNRTILSALRFDDKTTREARKQDDRMAPFRLVSDLFAAACKKHFNPGKNLTVDERMVPYRGRVKFRVYISNKPDKYGMKLWMLVDSANYYVLNFQPYLGKIGDKSEKELGKRVVKDLTCYLGHGYHITCDNFFTSARLAQDLLAEQNKTLLGTIRSNRKEVPDQLRPKKDREVLSSSHRFCEHMTLCSYVPKKNKAVILLSTLHTSGEIPEENNPQKKPQMILDYNETKCGVDILDRKVKQYSTRRGTRRWTMAMFYNFLDIAACNAHIIYNLARGTNESRKDFLKALSRELIVDFAKIRVNQPQLTDETRSLIKKLIDSIEPPREASEMMEIEFQSSAGTSSTAGTSSAGTSSAGTSSAGTSSAGTSSAGTSGTGHLPANKGKRVTKRCPLCPPSSRRKSDLQCLECKNWPCKDHRNVLCNTCHAKFTQSDRASVTEEGEYDTE